MRNLREEDDFFLHIIIDRIRLRGMMFAVRSFVVLAVLLGLGLLSASPSPAQERVELYTVGVGDALFTKFGHAALCVVGDEQPGGGICYNYGTSDFSRPVGLGWDVVRGRARFWVSVSDLVSMILWFQSQDRTIYRQILPLTPERVERLRNTLAMDATPENREYIYSHFLENCSTRPRDLINDATDGSLEHTKIENGQTYRDFAREGFSSSHWALVPAGDLILGRWVDQDIGAYEAMFIPRVLRDVVEETFGAEPSILYERQAPLAPANVSGAQLRFWCVVLVLALLAWLSLWGGRLAVSLVVLLGILIWAGAILSPWPELRWNELSLVLLPSDALLLWKRYGVRYAQARLGMLGGIAVLAVVGVFVQPIWPFWVLAAACMLASLRTSSKRGAEARSR